MPVTGMTGRESPSDRFDRNAILDMTIPGYVNVVVVIIEIAMIDRQKAMRVAAARKGKSVESAFFLA